ncbi:MAG TPA: 3-deoxy-manno-octulosonate cytidylyltransferase [Candidatus Acidoferrum sp.]|nr:3-deoxy-manno-octulosonate cytidylyltransferase [Candidatus Acidoferrum sp.]
MSLSVLGIIPARLGSTRLPRKPLLEIAGRPMVVRVWEAARPSPHLTDLLVATDSEEIVEVCQRYHVPAVLTDPGHPSGTDRIWEVAQGRVADVYVNIQGDEPLITSGHIAALVRPFIELPDTQVTTLRIRATDEEAQSPTVTKVVCNADNGALYFSKLPIPFDRGGTGVVRYKHPGCYAYRRVALEQFHRLPPSPLERAEGLEQLRFLEADIPIIAVETTEPTIGVDTEEDLRAVEAIFAARR